MIRLVIFDWNGTLIADTAQCWKADNLILKTFGGKPINLQTFRKTFEVPVINFYIQHGCDKKRLLREAEQVGKTFHPYYERLARHCQLRAGAKTLLKLLKKRNIESTIISNHTINGIDSQLKRLGIQKYFTTLLANSTLDTAVIKQNKTEKLKKFLIKHKYKQNETLVIGDTAEEIKMARAVGAIGCAIAGGYQSRDRLVQTKPNYLVTNLTEVIKIVSHL